MDEIFGHLLAYQETEEFREAALEYRHRDNLAKRDVRRKASATYRRKHLEARQLRQRASRQKQALYESQHGTCAICRMPMNAEDYQVDHIVPIIKGGTNDADNLQAVHRRCNLRKGAK